MLDHHADVSRLFLTSRQTQLLELQWELGGPRHMRYRTRRFAIALHCSGRGHLMRRARAPRESLFVHQVGAKARHSGGECDDASRATLGLPRLYHERKGEIVCTQDQRYRFFNAIRCNNWVRDAGVAGSTNLVADGRSRCGKFHLNRPPSANVGIAGTYPDRASGTLGGRSKEISQICVVWERR